MINIKSSNATRFRWSLRVGALLTNAAVLAGAAVLTSVTVLAATTGVAHAGTATVSATADPDYGFDNTVNAVGYLGNTVYAAGVFANAVRNGKLTARAGLGAVDATTGALLPWAPVVDGPVNALVVDAAGNSVYIAGSFSHVNGASRDGVAQLDATTGALAPFTHTISGTPRALAVAAGRVYLGGSITAVDGVPVGSVAAFTLGTGLLDPGFVATADGPVLALAYDPVTARLYLGGKFHNINGASRTGKLAAVNPATGVVVGAFVSAAVVQVKDITFGPDTVYAALGGSGGRVVAYTTSGAVRWQLTTDGDTQAVGYLGGALYVGGHFDNACQSPLVAAVGGTCLDGSTSRVKFLAVDGTTGALLAWDPHSSGVHGVLHFAVNASLGTIAAGGEFTTIGGAYRKRFAQFSP